ncbi:MAG: HD domain-containing protein [Planctomycetes bacterium]|nr:HD domain-containing protein [Planctomycetota bacterium]
MKRIPISLLPATDSLPTSLIHENGTILFEKGERITYDHVRLLEKYEIKNVWQAEPGDNLGEFITHAQCELIPLDKATNRHLIGKAVYAENGKLLLNRGVPLNTSIRKELESHGAKEIWVQKASLQLTAAQKFLDEKLILSEKLDARKIAKISLSKAKLLLDLKDLSAENVSREITPEKSNVVPEGDGLKEKLFEDVFLYAATPAERDDLLAKREIIEGRITEIFEHLRSEEGFDSKIVTDTANEVVEALVANPSLLIGLVNLEKRGEYIIQHSMNVGILATNIATALGYSQEQVFEIAFAAFLNDIGMIKVPEEITGKLGKLTDQEFKEVAKHPYHALEILREIKNGIPKSTPVTIFSSHEKIDGSGYPRRSNVELIHRFAQIIHVADMYDALISHRPHRTMIQPYKALEFMLHEVKKGRLPSFAMRGLLDYIGLFPIGTHVKLNTGQIARVLNVAPGNHTQPLVRPVFFPEREEIIRSDEPISISKSGSIRIVSYVPDSELPKEVRLRY